MPLAPPIPQGTPNLADNVAGGLRTTGGGRTDSLPISVQPGAYVIPADIVSALGEGNTANGMRALDAVLGAMMPKAPGLAGRQPLNVAVAGGEYICPPQVVAAIGNGDMDAGHATLDAFVQLVRRQTVKHLRSLPGAKR